MTHPTAPAGTSAMIARQAIMNGHQSVIGYELFNRSRSKAEHTAASDVALVFTALSHAGAEELVGKTMLFVNCTHESLSGGHLELVNPERMVLEIPPLDYASVDEVQARAPLLAELRERGFHLAFSHKVLETAYAPWQPLADYIKLDLSLLPADQVAVLIDYASRHSQAELIAEKIETAQQYDLVSAHGVELFQGYWFSRPALVHTKLLPPAQAHIIQLLNLVRQQAGIDDIEEVLKKDAGLGFNLMRLINSAGLGFSHEVTSFRQAVLLLGMKKLFRWAALLLTAVRGADTPPAIGQTAVVRGRFMELLALQFLTPDEADKAFVVGLFSLLDQLLSMPLDSAIQLLDLAPDLSQALIAREGRLGRLLALVQACEQSDESALDPLAQQLGLSNQQINQAHLQALAWADQLSA